MHMRASLYIGLRLAMIAVQAHLAGVQVGRQELHQMRLLNQKLERALSGRATEQQAAADKEAAAAVQAAAHVARLEHHIDQLKVRPHVIMRNNG